MISSQERRFHKWLGALSEITTNIQKRETKDAAAAAAAAAKLLQSCLTLCEGGAAAWLVGTLMVPCVWGHGLPPPQELWPYQSFFKPLVAGDQKASSASLSL